MFIQDLVILTDPLQLIPAQLHSFMELDGFCIISNTVSIMEGGNNDNISYFSVLDVHDSAILFAGC